MTSTETSTSASASASAGGVALRGISKHFHDTVVLQGIDLTVERGEFVAVIGPSGCGKSTLLRIVGGLVRPDTGVVSIFGESIDRATEHKHIGLVPQSPALLAWRTVLQNVQLPLLVNRKNTAVEQVEPVAILQAFGLGEVLHRYPHELSGGMAQRVAIARAFAINPSLLLMDEPFSSLDELTRETLRYDLLRRWQEDQKTVLFVTHSVTEAVLLSDRIVVMSSVVGDPLQIINVNLSRPREKDVELCDEFRLMERAVRSALRGESP